MNVEHRPFRPEAAKTGDKEGKFKREDFNAELKKTETRERPGKLLELYRPEALAAGGVNVVFEVAEHPNVVAKVSMYGIEKTLEQNVAAGRNPEALTDERRQELLDQVNVEKERIKTLKKYFPKRFFLAERFYLQDVPVNRGLLEASIGRTMASKGDAERRKVFDSTLEKFGDREVEMPTIVRIQERIPDEILKSKDTIDLSFGYREKDKNMSAGDYRRWNEDLLEGPGEQAADYLRSIDRGKDTHFSRLIDQMESDSELRAMIKEFVQGVIGYTKNEKEMLDIFGGNNLLVHKDGEGKWTMTFADERHPTKRAWKLGEQAVQSQFGRRIVDSLKNAPEQQKRQYARETEARISALNYVRDINALAALAGVEDRLALPAFLAERSDEMYSEFRDYLKVPTTKVPEAEVQKVAPGKTPDRPPQYSGDEVEDTLVFDPDAPIEEESEEVKENVTQVLDDEAA